MLERIIYYIYPSRLRNAVPRHFLLLLKLGPLLLGEPRLFRLDLVRPSNSDILWPEVTESSLQCFFDNVAAKVVDDHDYRHCDLEVEGKGHELELLVELGDEFGGARECDKRDTDEAPVHTSVFSDAFSEWPALVVDGKGRYLLDELQEVDRTIEE